MIRTTYAKARAAVRALPPGYFAVVMATGVISVGLKLEGQLVLSHALFAIALVVFALLVVMNCWRLSGYREQMVADLRDPRQSFGYFTAVAGANVLGTCLVLRGNYTLAAGLLIAATAGWLLLGYAVPWATMIEWRTRRGLAGVHGTWFMATVASQSVAVLASSLEPHLPGVRDGLGVLAVVAWAVGVLLYFAQAVLLMLRQTLHEFEFDPSYWITMGAASITVLAGARIVQSDPTPVVDAVRDAIASISVLLWALATWLIPALGAAVFWRHRLQRVRLTYEPLLWSMVFPLGMYAVASIYLGNADTLPWISVIGSVELWVAVAVWALTFGAMISHLVRLARARPS